MEKPMAQDQRAKLRDGPLADLFRSTLGDEHEEPVEPAVAKPGERETPEQQFHGPSSGIEPSVASREALEVELQSAEARLERARDQDGEFARTLEAMESELASAKRWTDRAWDRAMRCLIEWEERASEAERNAVRAEELAKRLSEQKVWEQRLRVLLDRINRAENRAATEPSSERYVGNWPAPPSRWRAGRRPAPVVAEASLTPTADCGSTRPSRARAGRRSPARDT
jgi:hypothetical protein